MLVVKSYLPVAFIFCIILSIFSCRVEDELTTDPSAKLSFSTDTVMFDTVITQVGQPRPVSITKQLRVVNNNKNAVKTNIRLSGKFNNVYRINIDGKPGSSAYGKEIAGKDSIIIFIQVYIEQGGTDLPFIVDDQLIFETNGNVQDVDLIAWGQDAKYFNNATLDCTGGNLHWTNEKPYVIYDSILVPSGCTLTIDPGTKIYSHNASCFLVAGTLIVNGTPTEPVIFQGDRLDAEYKDLSNQWAGIRLLPRSKDNVITGAIIRNGFVGIEVDSLPVTANPNLTIRQSVIHNMAAAGIAGYTAHIESTNNLISNCGQYGFFGALGGDYRLLHNTIVGYGTSNRQSPMLVFDNSPYRNESGQIVKKDELTFSLINNIVYGNLEEELLFNNNAEGIPIAPQTIQNNLFKTKQALDVNGNIRNKDPQFEDILNLVFALKATSPAKGSGTATSVTIDLRNTPRSSSAPSMGCYE